MLSNLALWLRDAARCVELEVRAEEAGGDDLLGYVGDLEALQLEGDALCERLEFEPQVQASRRPDSSRSHDLPGRHDGRRIRLDRVRQRLRVGEHWVEDVTERVVLLQARDDELEHVLDDALRLAAGEVELLEEGRTRVGERLVQLISNDGCLCGYAVRARRRQRADVSE